MLGISFAVIRLRFFFDGRSTSSMPLSRAAGKASQKWRNAFLSRPMSTNITFKPIFFVFAPPLKAVPAVVAGAAALDAIFFEPAILEQRHATLELLHADY